MRLCKRERPWVGLRDLRPRDTDDDRASQPPTQSVGKDGGSESHSRSGKGADVGSSIFDWGDLTRGFQFELSLRRAGLTPSCSMSPPIRILLADDHPVYLDGLSMAVAGNSDIEVMGKLNDGRLAYESIMGDPPDVALVDLDMPGMNGIALAKALGSEGSGCRLIIVSMHKNAALISSAIDAGIHGYLLKDSAAGEIVKAVRSVAGGGTYFSPLIASILVAGSRRKKAAHDGIPHLRDLTTAERGVLRMIASDRTSKEIAADLGISVRTVENHRSRASRKLGLSGAHSLVKFAFEHREKL